MVLVFFSFLHYLYYIRFISNFLLFFTISYFFIMDNFIIWARRIKLDFFIRLHGIAWRIYFLSAICSKLNFIIIICLSYNWVYLELEYTIWMKYFFRNRISLCFFHFVNCFQINENGAFHFGMKQRMHLNCCSCIVKFCLA